MNFIEFLSHFLFDNLPSKLQVELYNFPHVRIICYGVVECVVWDIIMCLCSFNTMAYILKFFHQIQFPIQRSISEDQRCRQHYYSHRTFSHRLQSVVVAFYRKFFDRSQRIEWKWRRFGEAWRTKWILEIHSRKISEERANEVP